MLQIGVGGAEVTWLAHRAEVSVLIPKLGRRVTSPFQVAQNCGYGGILGVAQAEGRDMGDQKCGDTRPLFSLCLIL